MSDVGPYGTTQNPNADRITANALFGAPAGNTTGDAFTGMSAALFSTAPYVPPRPQSHGCRGRDGHCRAYPVTGTDYCIFHTKEISEPSATA